jgi:catechol 2,3-dioxygenase-like lactoylglutathione lyase family enzyme
METNRTKFPVVRIARASANLDALLPFYVDGLGLDLLYRFEGHDGFDGIILGKFGAPVHFEFTRHDNSTPTRIPDEDDLVVIYVGDEIALQAIVTAMKQRGFEPVSSNNPYWDQTGVTFADPDGFRVVIESATWPL